MLATTEYMDDVTGLKILRLNLLTTFKHPVVASARYTTSNTRDPTCRPTYLLDEASAAWIINLFVFPLQRRFLQKIQQRVGIIEAIRSL